MYGQKSKLFLGLCLLAIFVAASGRRKVVIELEDEDGPNETIDKEIVSEDGDRIVNGQNATITQIPYIVQVIDKYAFGDHGFLCGGTLVSENHVISAAHCYKTYNGEDLAVVAGASFLKNDPGAIRRDVKAIYKHPKYDPETEDYDIVVIKLSTPLPLGESVKVAEMCESTWKGDEKIMVAGWGHTVEKAAKHSNQLQIVKLDTVTRKKCIEEYEGITERMSCSVVTKGKDACQGDSGGPAFYKGQLCGVVSFGFGCGREANPAVFSNIPTLKEFISESMKK